MKTWAITPRLTNIESYNETRDCLDINWYKFIRTCGAVPFVLPTDPSAVSIIEELQPDGIIFSGGNDLSSISDNEESRLRDSHEKNILKHCIEKEIPVIGVCRGMQLIGEYFNAALKPIEGHVAKKHKINTFFPLSSKKAELVDVNSYHNYSLEKVPSDFKVLAETENGTPEAMLHSSLPIAAIMWHPEREADFRKADIDFFTKILRRN